MPWEKFDPEAYIKNNYSSIHEEDRLIIHHLAKFYSNLPQLELALEIGIGPNLYPVMAMLPLVEKVECLDFTPANIKYLRRQLKKLDKNWYQFWRLFKSLNSKYNINLVDNLKQKMIVKKGDIYKLDEKRYSLSSMFFCAESVATNYAKFALACRKFANSVKPGGYMVAAFMENSRGYEVRGIKFPAYPVDTQLINEIFTDLTGKLIIKRIPLAKRPLRPGYTGMILLTASKD
jgi:hypothetical protein